MAGRGPAPKRGGRQRNAAPRRGDWEQLEPLTEPVLPELDELEEPAAGWRDTSRRLWAAWRSDPVTQKWNASDIALACDTILLHTTDPFLRSGEIRLRLDTLALTPKGRRDARLLLPQAEGEADGPQPPSFLSHGSHMRVLPEAK